MMVDSIVNGKKKVLRCILYLYYTLFSLTVLKIKMIQLICIAHHSVFHGCQTVST